MAALLGLRLLCLASAAAVAAAMRMQDSDEVIGRDPHISKVSFDALGDDSVACEQFDNLFKGNIESSVSANVFYMMKQHDLVQEYRDLMDALLESKKGKLNNWKCSALYRTMYLLGYEARFAAKNIALHLTKEKQTGKLGRLKPSIIKLCFVDTTKGAKHHKTSHYYTDGKRIRRKHGPKDVLPDGVVGQSYDGYPLVQSDPSTMPVDLLKLLTAKDALLENMNMAAQINVGEKSLFWAAKGVRDFQDQFKRKGLIVNLNRQKSDYECCDVKNDCKTCTEWHSWFEYADVSVVGEGYVPKNGKEEDVRFGATQLAMYDKCMAGDAEDLATAIGTFYGQKQRGDCADVAGGVRRKKSEFPQCKCEGDDEYVYCGTVRVMKTRKFDVTSVESRRECEKRKMYCSIKPCRPPPPVGAK